MEHDATVPLSNFYFVTPRRSGNNRVPLPTNTVKFLYEETFVVNSYKEGSISGPLTQSSLLQAMSTTGYS